MTSAPRALPAFALLALLAAAPACALGAIEGDDPPADTSGTNAATTSTNGATTSTNNGATGNTTPGPDAGDTPDADTPDTPAPDAPPDTPAQLGALELSANVATVRAGRAAVVSVTALDQDGAPMATPGDLAWASSDPDVLVFEDGRVRARAEGRADLTARSGEVVSNPLTFTVLPAPDAGDASLRVAPPATTTLAPGQTLALTATLRDPGGVPAAPEALRWASSDPAVLTVDDEGHAVAVAPGAAEVWASDGPVTSPRLRLTVTAADRYIAVDLLTPSGDAVARDTLLVHALPERRITGSPSAFGEPFQPDTAQVWINGAYAADLTPDLLGASGVVDLAGLPPGPFALEVRVTDGGDSGASAPVTVERLAPDAHNAAWADMQTLGMPSWRGLFGLEGQLWTVGDALYTVDLRCGRECSAIVSRWAPEVGSGEWPQVQYQQRHFKETGGALTEELPMRANVDLPRYVGWGWPSISARDLYALPRQPRSIVAWSNAEARTSFNLEGAPERFWNDCYVAEWSPTAGFDGQGGWALYSEDDPDYQSDPPHPDAGAPGGENHLPAGADAVRQEDCSTPMYLLEDTGDLLLAFVSAALPGDAWHLRLRRWDGAAWTDVGAPLRLQHPDAQLRGLAPGDGGLPVAAVDYGGRPGVVVRFDGAAWAEDPHAPPAHALVPLDASGALAAASVHDGDLTVWTSSQGAWVRLGDLLDAHPWAQVHDVSLIVQDGLLAVAWTEGPNAGQRDLYAAVWQPALAQWTRVGDGPLDLEPDRDASAPDLIVDPQGRLTVAYSTPNPDDPNNTQGRNVARRVARTLDPITP